MRHCSHKAGNYLSRVNKSSCYPHKRATIVLLCRLIFFLCNVKKRILINTVFTSFAVKLLRVYNRCFRINKLDDHWSFIAHLSAEDMLKSAAIEEKKFKHSPWAGADNPLGPKFDVNRKASSLWSFVASLKRISSTSDFIHIFS